MALDPNDATSPFSSDAWRTTASESWLVNADRLEEMLEPVHEPLLAIAALAPGERVLDVGCGRGSTARRAAMAVGPSGSVVAVDVAVRLIAAAEATPLPADAAPIEWVVGDAQHVELPLAGVDAVISRFGVMFFDDPVDAFANIRRATRPGGRLAVATWRPRDASPFQSAGYDAAMRVLKAEGYDVTPKDPAGGPFSFGVDKKVHEILGGAGWTDVVVHAVEMPLYFAGPGASADDAVEVALGMAGWQDMLAPFDDAAREIAAAALRDVYGRNHDGTGVRLDAAMAVLGATNAA
ncbi:methyltransferase domain-containing protein [soil metagenome]